MQTLSSERGSELGCCKKEVCFHAFTSLHSKGESTEGRTDEVEEEEAEEEGRRTAGATLREGSHYSTVHIESMDMSWDSVIVRPQC